MKWHNERTIFTNLKLENIVFVGQRQCKLKTLYYGRSVHTHHSLSPGCLRSLRTPDRQLCSSQSLRNPALLVAVWIAAKFS